MAEQVAQKLLLIGWSGAEWDIIHHMIAAGLMPNLQSMMAAGSEGSLELPELPGQLPSWASVSTGLPAHQHGVYDQNSGKRTTKSIWEILSDKGLKTNILAWPGEHPQAALNGIGVSPGILQAGKSEGESWKIRKGTVHPPEQNALIAGLRMHPTEITQAHLQPFVPKLSEMDLEHPLNVKRLMRLRKIVADCGSLQAIATWLLERSEWDFTAVHFDGLQRLSRNFMQFHPPKMDQVQEKQFEYYRHVIQGGYRLHDMMLGRLLELVGEDARVLLISNHGFVSGSARESVFKKAGVKQTDFFNSPGICVCNKPRPDDTDTSSLDRLTDVMPWVLKHFHIDTADYMPAENIDADLQAEVPEVLEEDPDRKVFQAARKLINDGNHAEAIPSLQEVFALKPDSIQAGYLLGICYLKDHRSDDANRIATKLEKENEEINGWIWMLKGKVADAEKNYPLAVTYYRQAVQKLDRNFHAHFSLGKALKHAKKFEEAAKVLTQAVFIRPAMARAHYQLGETLYRIKDYEGAAKSMETLLEMRPSWNKARQWLVMINENHLNKKGEAQKQREDMIAATQKEVFLLAGYPISGVQQVADQLRKAGKLVVVVEQDKEKTLETRILSDAADELLQLPMPLIRLLPARYRYKLLFVEQNTEDWIKNRHSKLVEAGKLKEDVFHLGIQQRSENFVNRINRILDSRPQIEVHRIDYDDLMLRADETITKAMDFLQS